MADIEQTQLPMEDGVITSVEHPIKLSAFEGPLDLLLFLIRKHEINIYDIPIKEVTEQYLDMLSTMGKMNLEIAGDFFVMAATLMYIKSKMLLPKHEQKEEETSQEEEIDPRWELVQQLIQYKKFKSAATELMELIERNQSFVTREVQEEQGVEPQEAPLQKSEPIELWTLFNQVVKRLTDRIVVGEIQAEEITVSDCMEKILKLCEMREPFLFSSLIPEKCTVNHLAATFLAMLELTRLKKLFLRQDELFSDVVIMPRFDDPPSLNELQRTRDSSEEELADDTLLENTDESSQLIAPHDGHVPVHPLMDIPDSDTVENN